VKNYVHLSSGIRRHYTLEIYLPLTEVVENLTTATYLPLAGVVERFTCYTKCIIAARPGVDLFSGGFVFNDSDLSPAGGSGRAIYMLHKK